MNACPVAAFAVEIFAQSLNPHAMYLGIVADRARNK